MIRTRNYMIVDKNCPEHYGRIVQAVAALTEGDTDEELRHHPDGYFEFDTIPVLRNQKGQKLCFGMEELILMPDDEDDELAEGNDSIEFGQLDLAIHQVVPMEFV